MIKPIAPKQQSETRSAVERIGAFATAVRPEHLTTDIRELFKRNILDSIGCAIAAVAGPSLQALRDQIEEYRAPGRRTLIGGGKTSPDQAALFNSALVRYVDLLDSYMAQGGLCHPSDNFRTILAAAEYVEASGEEFMLALAAAYEIQCRFTACVPVMAKGFNHAIQLAISAAAGAGRLFGLSVNELANAIAIATVDNISLACVHAEPVSQWKGLEWLAKRDRTYEEVMDAWRTSCPRLPVWEEANDRGLVITEQVHGRCVVRITSEGLNLLKQRRPSKV